MVHRRRARRRRELGDVLEGVNWVGPGPGKVLAHHLLEHGERLRLDVQLPVEVLAHLALHLVHLAQLEHPLPDDAPALVGVGVVADDLGGEHEGGDEEAVARGPARGGEARLEPQEEVERGEGDGGVQFRVVEGIGDEVREFGLRAVGRGRIFWACKDCN